MDIPVDDAARAGSPALPPLDLSRDAIFIDIDGTLVEIVERPEIVSGDGWLTRLLTNVADRAGGALALVTGRTIADADRILGGAVESVAGLHGGEIRLRKDLFLRTSNAPQAMASILASLTSMVDAGNLAARIEDKGASLALHYRHSPQSESQVYSVARALAAKHGLRLLSGKMVFEIAAGSSDKGDAIGVFMGHAPFSGRIPIAIGDDVTDEDAFAKARALGGVGVYVGSERPPESANYRLPGVAAVHDWLRTSIGALTP